MTSVHDNDSDGPQVANWDRHLQVSPRSERPRTLERLSSGGIETLSSPSCDNTLLEGMRSPGLDSLAGYEKPIQPYYPHDGDILASSALPKVKRICGIPIKWLIIGTVALSCVLVALGVALGVTLSRKASGTAHPIGQLNSSSSVTAEVKVGAFNGSGVAVAGESFDFGGHGETVLYFQHYSGQIRSTQLQPDGTWQGGSLSEVVATDAKDASPISAVSYSVNGTNTWHIFYIGLNNTVLERVNDNETNVWRDGPINQLSLQAMDDRNVGLQACWYGNYYGAPSYNKSRTGNETDLSIGMHLWYGATPTQLNEVVWIYGADEWTQETPFNNYNGHAGIGCYSWGDTSVTYVMLVNLQAEVEIWWKDLNTTLQSAHNHPINKWQNSSFAIPHLQPNTSLGYTDYLFVQREDNSLGGYNISWAAENSTIIKDDTFTITDAKGNQPKGLPGTHFTITALPNKSGGASVYTFFQMNGSDITEFQRDLSQGQWFSSQIPIPQQ